MSVMALSSAVGLLQSMFSKSQPAPSQKFTQEFQQLGQDLQSGNLSQARSDLGTVAGDMPFNPLYAGALSQLSQDLLRGNLTSAQSDYGVLQKELQGNGAVPAASLTPSVLHSASTQVQQLSQALEAGKLTTAQRAYTALQGEMAAFSPFRGAHNSSSAASSASALNLRA
jgi:hypothetical protein